MKKVPQKVFIALDSINNSLQSICDHKRKGRAFEVFFVLDTLLSFEGSISRAIGKQNFEELLISIRSTMRIYSQFTDNSNNVTWETVGILTKKSQQFLSSIIEMIRNPNTYRAA